MEYAIQTDIKYGPLERIDVARLARECDVRWWNQTLCKVNDCVLRLGVFEGEFHWHKHDKEDEVFYVIEGKLLLDLETQTVELEPGQGFLVPRGVVHRTRAPQRTTVIMVEAASIAPTGD